MSENIPELDRYEERLPNTSDWTWSAFQQHEKQLDIEAAQKFADLHGAEGDGTVYLSRTNSALLQDWIRERGGRISLKNLELAARELADQLEQRPTEPQAEPTPTPKYNPPVGQRVIPSEAERQLHAEFVRTFQDDPTQPDKVRKQKFAELRRAAIAERYSRRPESNQAMPIGTARAEVAKAHPELLINSPEYNAAVANLVRGEI